MSNIVELIKAQLKRKKSTPPPVIKPEIVELDIIEKEIEIVEPVEIRPVPKVVIQWKGKSKTISNEPEEVDTEERAFVCELCPINTLHTMEEMVQCEKCGEWFCLDHINWHIRKRHRVI